MRSQQKCIVIFALVCCFAILVALIFSAVDIMGEDEDGLSEKNCQNKCRFLFSSVRKPWQHRVQTTAADCEQGKSTIPGIFSHENPQVGQYQEALRQGQVCLAVTVDVLADMDGVESRGQRLFEKLLQLTSQNVEIKLVSDVTADSKVLEALKSKGAEVTYMNMTAYNKGRLQSSFWIVDKQHVYIGSAGLDWQSLGQMKELGVIFYNCSCLVLDLQRIFALYSSLKFKSRVPQTWSKRLYGVYDNEKKLQLQLNETKSQAFVSNSPKLFCPKNRSFDIDAIYSVIDDAKQYVYIAVMDYLPISSTSTKRTYWPDLDGKIREALVLRSIKVRLLISFWKETDPLTFNFISSLKAICTEIANCSLKVKFFDLERENACATKEQKNHTFPRLNRNKYMVTDGAAYIGNFDWVGNDFTQNAGTGLVINQADVRNNTSIIKQLKDVFERDWYSPYSRTLQPTKQPNCSSLFKLRPSSNKTVTYNASGKDP
ncbi:hypothetical protein E2I00_013911 [Balaenoptera physalus]|uniref:PLD phosphodiesterase domain-containing protein n=1 Tax=Balaenoptera physalus TaxID=9770 RepID=A0A643CG98_BALPH|nr:hypothetical protein E2I00_013911 [Balaenoptera physalus]